MFCLELIRKLSGTGSFCGARWTSCRFRGHWRSKLCLSPSLGQFSDELVVATKRLRPGFTLVELLVVIVIMVLLLAVAVPLMRLGLEDQEIREVTRQLNAQMALAKSMAAEKGRPVGVMFQRKAGEPEQCIEIFVVEVPPPYSGDFAVSRVLVNAASPPGGIGTAGTVQFDSATCGQIASLVRDGDLIRFNYQGPYYRLTYDPAMPYTAQITHPTAPAPQVGPGGVPFQILRQPTRSVAAPLELSGRTVIDLSMSGVGLAGTQFTPSSPTDVTPVIVVFNPGGQVDQVFAQGVGTPILAPAYFLIGSNEKVGGANLADQANRWVAVGQRTGLVTSAENKDVSITGYVPPGPVPPAAVAEAREIASRGQAMGGR